MYEGIIEPSLLYGCETWVLNVRDRKTMEAVEMNCLRNICGLRRIDRVPNVEIRRMCGKNVSVSQRMDQGVLKWFGHVERMGNERLVKRVYDSEVRGVRRKGRPRKRWMNGVKETLERKGLNIQEAKVSVQDRSGWRSICRGGGLFDEPLVMPQQGVYEAVRWLIVEGMAPLGFHPCVPIRVE